MYHAWTEIINEESEIVLMQEKRPIEESVYSMILNRWRGGLQYIGDFLFEVNTLRKNGGFYKLPLAWASDDISAFIAAQETGVVNSQIPLFQYRINASSISSSSDSEIKLKAINLEQLWYKSFLEEEPEDKIDRIFRKMIQLQITKHFKRKVTQEIANDMYNKSWIRLFHYIRKRRTYDLSLMEIGYSLICYFRLSFASRRY